MKKQVLPSILVIILLISTFKNFGFTNKIGDPIKIFRKNNTLLLHTRNKIKFNINSVKLDDISKYELGIIGNTLRLNKNIKIEIAVYNDSRSDPDFSKNITQKRAEVIKQFLINDGVNPDNLIAIGYGDEHILNKCKPMVKCTAKEHAVNRRVELKILNPEAIEDYVIAKRH